MIQLLNLEPEMVFHSTAIHTLDLSSCVFLLAERFLWSFKVISITDLVYKECF